MDRATVERVAKVARLALTDEELSRYQLDLEEILRSFEILDKAPSVDDFSFNPVSIVDVLREDEAFCDIEPEKLREQLDTYADYVRGPKLS